MNHKLVPAASISAALAAVAVLGIGVSACSSPPKSGTVIEHRYTEAYDTTYMQCTMYDTKGNCSVWMPVTQHWDETFELCLRSDSGKQGCRTVSEVEYDRYRDGDRYPAPG